MLKHGMKGLLLILLTLTLGAVSPLCAQDATAPTPEGHWEGAIQVPGEGLGINVDFMDDGGTWTGDISIPVQMLEDFALGGITVEGPALTFGMEGIPGTPTFRGTLSEDGQSITGTFSQAGQAFPFTLTRSD
jgi:hypothetical protein